MSEQKRYTAQEMKNAAKELSDLRPVDRMRIAAMLRQAADAEEELEKVRASKERWMQYQETAAGERNACIDELRKKDAEITQLKARLGAVVKECEKQIPECRGEDCKCNPTDSGYCDENCHDEIIVHTAVTAILRAARDESNSNNSSSYIDDIYNS